MTTTEFWSTLTSIAAFLDDDCGSSGYPCEKLAKELPNTTPEHRKRISDEIAIIIAKLTELKTCTAEATPPTLVAGEMAHQAEQASRR